jgi:CSLREA domain-containing protein
VLATGVATFGVVGPPVAHAATISVDTVVDSVAVDGACSLREAIAAANDDTTAGGDCARGAGADTVVLPSETTFVLASALPELTSEIVIAGNGSTINANGTGRALTTASTGEVTLDDITLTGGRATGGAGIENAGSMVITNSTLTGNISSSGVAH